MESLLYKIPLNIHININMNIQWDLIQ